MAMVELPPDERMAHYTVVRTNLAAAIKELGIEDTIANACRQDDARDTGARMEIEAGGGAGTA